MHFVKITKFLFISTAILKFKDFMKTILLLVIAFFCTYSASFAENKFTDRIGFEIDSVERSYFNFFPSVRGFRSAEYIALSADSGSFKVNYDNPDTSGQKVYHVGKHQIAFLYQFINQYETIDEDFYERNKFFEKFDFNKFSYEVIDMKFYFNQVNEYRVGLFNGETKDGILIWCDSLNIVICNIAPDKEPFTWNDLSNLEIIDLKDIKYINSFLPSAIYGQSELWNKWVETHAVKSLLYKEIGGHPAEFVEYLKNNSSLIQKVPVEVTIDMELLNSFFSGFFFQIDAGVRMTDANPKFNYFIWRDSKNEEWKWTTNKLVVKEATRYMISPLAIGYRLNRDYSIKTRLSILSSYSNLDYNYLSYQVKNIDFSVQRYIFSRGVSELDAFGDFEAGISVGMGIGLIGTKYEIDSFPIVYSNETYPGKGEENGTYLTATLELFSNINLSKNWAIISSLDYMYNSTYKNPSFERRASYILRPNDTVIVSLQRKEMVENSIHFNIGLRYNLR